MILESMGLDFNTVPPDVDEITTPEDPIGMVRENARRKCEWCRKQFPDAAVIAADTTVALKGRCLGKPHTYDRAVAMLKIESGQMQTVYTGYALYVPETSPPEIGVETSHVFFKHLDDQAIRAYINKTQPFDRAGAYDIDCSANDIIEHYDGSYTNIMGLPAERIKEWIACKLAN